MNCLESETIRDIMSRLEVIDEELLELSREDLNASRRRARVVELILRIDYIKKWLDSFCNG